MEDNTPKELIGIGARMRITRTNKKHTQAFAAEQLGISTKTYVFYEGEKREIPLSTALQFCKLYNVDTDWLFSGEPHKIFQSYWDLIEKSFKIALAINRSESKNYPDEKLAALAKLIASQSISSSKTPEEVAEELLTVI
jgi:DNA-binding XRE family transcriptional regulator